MRNTHTLRNRRLQLPMKLKIPEVAHGVVVLCSEDDLVVMVIVLWLQVEVGLSGPGRQCLKNRVVLFCFFILLF